MELRLYYRNDERIMFNITADLSDGMLSVRGHDLGPQVEEFFPEGEYEYSLSLDKDSTRRLFESLGCADASDQEKLQVIKDTFPNDRADSALKNYCTEHEIETTFWCWP